MNTLNIKSFYHSLFQRLWSGETKEELGEYFAQGFMTIYQNQSYSIEEILERVRFSRTRYKNINKIIIDIKKINETTMLLLSRIQSIDTTNNKAVEFYNVNLDEFRENQLIKSWLLSTTPIQINNIKDKGVIEDRTIERAEKENFKKKITLLLKDHYADISLTTREVDCLFLYYSGMLAKEIALQLNLSHRTVEKHLEHVRNKLHVTTKQKLKDLLSGYTILPD